MKKEYSKFEVVLYLFIIISIIAFFVYRVAYALGFYMANR